jgi:hypothetical protein
MNAQIVERNGESFTVDAAIVAEAFGLTEQELQAMMRKRLITSRYERGIDEDAGRHRLTFFKGKQRLCLIVDEAGRVIDRGSSTVD